MYTMAYRRRLTSGMPAPRQQSGGLFGFLPAVHSFLQTVKPITNGIALANHFGVADKISNALDSNAAGRALKSVGKFGQALGYGRRRRPVKRYGGSKAAPKRRKAPVRRKVGGRKRRVVRRRM